MMRTLLLTAAMLAAVSEASPARRSEPVPYYRTYSYTGPLASGTGQSTYISTIIPPYPTTSVYVPPPPTTSIPVSSITPVTTTLTITESRTTHTNYFPVTTTYPASSGAPASTVTFSTTITYTRVVPVPTSTLPTSIPTYPTIVPTGTGSPGGNSTVPTWAPYPYPPPQPSTATSVTSEATVSHTPVQVPEMSADHSGPGAPRYTNVRRDNAAGMLNANSGFAAAIGVVAVVLAL